MTQVEHSSLKLDNSKIQKSHNLKAHSKDLKGLKEGFFKFSYTLSTFRRKKLQMMKNQQIFFLKSFKISVTEHRLTIVIAS